MYHFVTGENRKGVVLQEYELELLTILYHHKLLTTKQMYAFIIQKTDITYIGFANRVKKLAKLDILVDHEYSLGQKGFRFKYYRIGAKGLEIIIDNQRLTGKIIRDIYRFSSVRNIDHFLSTQDLVVRTLIDARGEQIEVQSLSPHEEVMDVTEQSFAIIPDWLLKTETQTIYIELDTGKETNKVIKEKVERYVELSRDQPDTTHVVFFAILDDSFSTRHSYGKRFKRVGNIKQALLSVKGINRSNLEIYVLPLFRAKEKLLEVVKGESPHKEKKRQLDTELAIHTLDKLNYVFPYMFERQDIARYYPDNLERYYHVDAIYEVSTKGNTKLETVGVLLLEEGHIKNLDRLDYNHYLVGAGRFKEKIDRLLVVYANSLEMEEDVIGKQYHLCIIGSMEKWGYELEEQPTFYRLSSPYKKEITHYE
ncbi:replication-relaxation family protein (plasmid) [Sutcliffiella horikoshii]|uniref:replication-relaxation family protein n=1 Tax=Sutcliffiella horikoshii TaxID=79883 RepID=UPI001CBB8AC1|nr:replication-relaxation family protein [Sutcliffiella horikoshii]UAL49750.1 replication-relaxation family protein [Sutcliffiella horikoshii]